MEPEEKRKLEMKFQVIRDLKEYLMGKVESEKRKMELEKSNPQDQKPSKISSES